MKIIHKIKQANFIFNQKVKPFDVAQNRGLIKN